MKYVPDEQQVEAWAMNLAGIFKKNASETDEAFLELADSMSEMIDLELDAPSIAVEKADLVGEAATDEDTAGAEDQDAAEADKDHRLTSYAQSRLAALAAFDDLHKGSDDDLRQLGALLSRVQAAHHSTREFLSSMHTGVYRANELELAHAQLLAENRKLSQQVEQVKRLRSQHESLIETYKRRETKMIQDSDALKVELGRIGLEANETAGRVSTLESERADLLNKMAIKSSNAERLARENEILRERQVNLSLDLENVRTRQTEAERKLGEVCALRNAESAELLELRSRLAADEKEIYRLQKQQDGTNARLEEAQHALDKAESELDDHDKRYESETQRLKTEIVSLKKRLEAADKAQIESSDELGAVRQKLAEAVSERKLAEDRLAAAKREFESERKAMAASAGEAAEAVLKSQSNSILLDVHEEEVAKLRAEIDTLTAAVDRLGRYERMYAMARERRSRETRKAREASSAQADAEPDAAA